MKRLSLAVLAFTALACSGGGAAAQAPASDPKASEFKTEDEKTFYALGLMVGGNLKQFNLTAAEADLIKRGLGDSVAGSKPLVELATYGPKVQELAKARATVAAQAEKTQGKAVADAAEKEPGAVKTASGLVFRSLSPGKGASPQATSKVKVHYQGTLRDGTVFDSSVKRGQPAEFPLNGVIPCWTEALQKMKVGEKARIVCPPEIAYGDQGQRGIPGGATLTFEVELLAIQP
jgi:FKBP-type peptidyl-prolyl cis-trans isomerase FkpA